MKNQIFLIALLFLVTKINAQNSIKFENQFLPNKTYENENYTNSSFFMNFEGDEGFVAALKKNGIEIPMITKSSIIAVSETQTGKEIINKIPFTTNFKKVTKNQNLKGIETSVADSLEGSILYGFYEDRKNAKIDSIQSDKLSDETKYMLKNEIEETMQQIKYPDKSLNIGDSFEQSVPMEIPLSNLGNISFLINTKYLLKDISNGFALFDTVINFVLTSQITELKLDSNGTGKGLVEYDIKNKFTRINSSTYKLKMTAQKDELKILIEADADSNYTVKLKN